MSKKNKKSTIEKASPLKVILPVVCGLAVIAIVAVIIAVVTAPKKSAKVSKPNATYVTIGDYKVSRQEMYEALKSGSGLTTLQEIIDTDLLAGVTVTPEEKAEIYDKIVYGDESNYKDMTDEEKEDAKAKEKETYYMSLASMGFMTEAEQQNYVDLQILRYKYALEQYKQAVEAEDFTDEQYEEKFLDGKNQYEDRAVAIVLAFNTSEQVEAYLKMVGLNTNWEKLAVLEEVEELNGRKATLVDELAQLKAEYDALEDEAAKEAKQGEIEAKETAIKENETEATLKKTNAKLTAKEVTLKFIELYNAMYAYYIGANAYANGDKLLVEGTHYTVESSEVVFNVEAIKALEESNSHVKLIYTLAEAQKIDKDPTNYGSATASGCTLDCVLFDDLYVASELEQVEGGDKQLPNVYTKEAEVMTNSLYFLAYKIDLLKGETVPAMTAEEKAAIKNELIEENFNENIETKYLIELRQANGLTIYDRYLNGTYKAAYTYLYETALELTDYPEYASEGKKSNKLAFSYKANGKVNEVSADELFELLSARYGAQATVAKANSYFVLSNHDWNIIYDPYTNKVLDKESYKNVKDGFNVYNLYYYGQLTSVKEFKYAFENGVFESYGFPASYGWENFMHDYMLLNDDNALVGSLVLSQADTYFEYSKYPTEKINEEMQKIYDKYYSMNVINILVTVDYDFNNVPDAYDTKDGAVQDNWTDEQVALAKELTELVNNKRDESGDENATTLVTKLQAIAKLYHNATCDDATWGKYIAAGLKLTVENAQSYTSSSGLVEEFHTAMAAIYKYIEAGNGAKGIGENDSETAIYDKDEAFATMYGFHKVAIIGTSERIAIDENNGKDLSVLTIDLFKQHLKDSTTLTDTQNTAIETYLEPAITAYGTDNVNGLLKYELRVANADKINFADSNILVNYNKYQEIYKAYIDKQLAEAAK